MSTLPARRRLTREAQARILAQSDEREQHLREVIALMARAQTAFERGFRAGYRAGYCRQLGDSIVADEHAARAAVAAAEHWTMQQAERLQREYLRKAYGTPDEHRSDAQRAALAMWSQR